MNVLTVLLLLLVVHRSLASVIGHSDPSACQRIIKFMLINACGATKRENRPSFYKIMSEEEIEKKYHAMVKANMVKGVNNHYIERNDVENDYWDEGSDFKNKHFFEIDKKPQHKRPKRSVMPNGIRAPIRNIWDGVEHERRGSLRFVERLPAERDDRDGRSPPPGALKIKCCGDIIRCTMDDFKDYCEE